MQNQGNNHKQLTLEKLGRSLDILCSEVEGILKSVALDYTENEEQARNSQFADSFTRMIFIMVVTYCTLYGYMTLIGVDKAYLNAIVPTMGYNMSTWSLPYVKCLWLTFKEKTETNLAVHMSHDTRAITASNTVDVEMDAL